jgi:hypothetical protein
MGQMRAMSLVGVVLAVCGVLAACGGSAPAERPGGVAGSPVWQAPADTAALARQGARALVADVRLPAGAVALSDAAGLDASRSNALAAHARFVKTVSEHATWRVAASPQAVLRTVSAQLGRGVLDTATSVAGPVRGTLAARVAEQTLHLKSPFPAGFERQI